MRKVLPGVVLVLAVVVLVNGCDFGDDFTPRNDLDFDAAVVAADGTLEDLQMMHGPRLGLPGTVFPPLVGDRPNCPMTHDVFLCPPIERDGLSYSREITFLDADGAPQDAFIEGSTAAIHYRIAVEGEIARDWWTASIRRDRELTVTGLPLDGVEDDGVVTWNGTGTGSIQRSRHTDGGEVRSYNLESELEIDNVVMPYPRTEDGWPLSGTITRAMTITWSSDSDQTMTSQKTAVISFDGTQFATVTVGDQTYTIDLSERRAFGPGRLHRHGGRRGH